MMAARILENYRLLNESGDPEVRCILIDITNAIRNAKLTRAEWEVLKRLYISPALGDRKQGVGRPREVASKSQVASELFYGTKNSEGEFDTRKASAMLDKTLKSALKKIDLVLNYGDNDVSHTEMCNM